MVEIPMEVTKLIQLFANGLIWVYIAAFFVVMYLLISLLTWSFLKPLKYLGIPTICVGSLFLIIRSLSGIIINMIAGELNIVKTIAPSLLKPVLLIGLGSFFLGIAMVVIYVIINKKSKKSDNAILQLVEETPVVNN